MKVSEWLGIEARPQRGIMKKKPQRGKKHLVSDKEKSRLGEMFASYRQNKAMEGHEKSKHAECKETLSFDERG